MSRGIHKWRQARRRGREGPRPVELSGSSSAGPSSALIRLAHYLLPLWPKLLAGTLCLVVVSLLSLYYGVLGKHLLDAINRAWMYRQEGNATRVQVQLDHIDRYALLAAAVFLTKGLFAFGQIYLMSDVAQRLAMQVRNQVFEHLQSLSLSFFETQKTGQLMAAITTDVPVIQNSFTAGIVDSVSAPLVIVGRVAILFATGLATGIGIFYRDAGDGRLHRWRRPSHAPPYGFHAVEPGRHLDGRGGDTVRRSGRQVIRDGEPRGGSLCAAAVWRHSARSCGARGCEPSSPPSSKHSAHWGSPWCCGMADGRWSAARWISRRPDRVRHHPESGRLRTRGTWATST